MSARNLKLTVAYDGSKFLGWQRQARGPTVQGLLEETLQKLCGHPVALHGSGRTDAGVHARGQTASFFTSSPRTPAELVRGGNALLPPDAAIVSAEEVDDAFHARFSARGKVYAYRFSTAPVRDPFLRRWAWHVGPCLDWRQAEAILPVLVGEQDFAAFRSSGDEVKSTVRTIFSAVLDQPQPHVRRLTVAGSGFLRHMVRTIAGTLWLSARGKLTPADLEAILASKDRAKAGPTAPACGLCLEQVFYD
ncbi:MAG: tRNA pseudouridine(38-40) synthase TruA [Deltaproteobacteria bacterium]|jgi:tRNA pseudouridine38-40 synthase|nr:tRNA pseudouridine(38-40) synthase TruA [Deltaproteobacteria bacterium]